MDKDFQKYLKREIKDLNTKLDLVYGEREILEDILGSIKALSEKLTYHREHIDNIVQDVKADVKESQISVEDKVDQVQEEVKDGNEVTKELKEEITK